jgi:hypothetical protein
MISAPLAMADDATITVTLASSTLTISNLQTTSRSLTKAGAGTLVVNRIRGNGLTINDGTVRVLANGSATGVSVINTLSLAASATLDLADNNLIVNQGNYTQIRNLVRAGLNSTAGITSSTSDGSQILALFDNALLGRAQWEGFSISPAAIVGKFTYFGDINLDGQVTGDDYTVIDANLNTTPAVGLEWLRGDGNLDGSIAGDDYTVVDGHLGLGTGNPLSPNAIFVPEPRAAILLLLGFALFLNRSFEVRRQEQDRYPGVLN